MQRHSMLFRAAAAAAVMTFAAAQTASACTGIMLRNADGSIVHGRTVEFGIPLAIDFAVVPRGYAFTGMTPMGQGKKWTAKYGALGAIVFGNLGIMDGVNEKGLAIGAFYFPTMAEYTPTTPDNQSKSMSFAPESDPGTHPLTQYVCNDQGTLSLSHISILVFLSIPSSSSAKILRSYA